MKAHRSQKKIEIKTKFKREGGRKGNEKPEQGGKAIKTEINKRRQRANQWQVIRG
jgi:hypothetical protein